MVKNPGKDKKENIPQKRTSKISAHIQLLNKAAAYARRLVLFAILRF